MSAGSTKQRWLSITPDFQSVESQELLAKHAQQIEQEHGERDGILSRERLRGQLRRDARVWPRQDSQRILSVLFVLTDLLDQGWRLRVRDSSVQVSKPTEILANPKEEKDRIRRQELVKRDAQLRNSAVSTFVRGMEKRRLYQGRFVSIFSLMRDGRDLARALREAREACTDKGTDAFDEAIDPYLQFIDSGETCRHTGLNLQDIWRYFRHTWSNQYTTVPGRSMLFMVRDRAAEFHPIIGIGALNSPIVQIRERDAWIGWLPDTFIEDVRREPSLRVARWLCRVVDEGIEEVYLDDLYEEELLTPGLIREPTPELIQKLIEHGKKERELHHRFVSASEHKRRPASSADEQAHWIARARTHLYRSKRALALARFLEARMVMRRYFGERPTRKKLVELLSQGDGVRVVRKIVRKAKADRVGIVVADISVCGAVQPYNAILGGKLVSMLATSPEVVAAYKRRYRDSRSEIASGVAGRPIVRSQDLVLLGTTSLYGVGSSQYNRVRIPCELVGGPSEDQIRFLRLGKSKAFGTSHFSDETVGALVSLAQQSQGGQRVNSIFGEGVSPKLRKVRRGLDLLGLPSEEFLQHGRHRIVYGVSFIENLRDFLLGIDTRPRYLMSLRKPEESTWRIGSWWKQRWLSPRVQSDEILARVEEHTLILPIRHGARVARVPDPYQESLPF